MIVLGVCPGLNALAYAVVRTVEPIEPLDADVLYSRPLDAASARNLVKRSRVHRVILDVVAERNLPTLVAIGPPAMKDEDPEHALAMAENLRAMALHLKLPVETFGKRHEVFSAVGADERSFGRIVHAALNQRLNSRDRRVVLAAGVALAAASRLR